MAFLRYVTLKHGADKVIVFERGDLLFVFNFHPCNRALALRLLGLLGHRISSDFIRFLRISIGFRAVCK